MYIPNLENENQVSPKGSEIQRIASIVNLGCSYVNKVFKFAHYHLKELKTIEEITKFTEFLCVTISKERMTTEAYEFIKSEIYKFKHNEVE